MMVFNRGRRPEARSQDEQALIGRCREMKKKGESLRGDDHIKHGPRYTHKSSGRTTKKRSVQNDVDSSDDDIVITDVIDWKSEDKFSFSASSRKPTADTRNSQGLDKREKKGKNVSEMSVETFESDDDIQIVSVSDWSTGNSICSSSKKKPRRDKNKIEEIVPNIESSEESSNSENISSSDSIYSSDSLYAEDKDSTSSDELVSSDDAKDSSSASDNEGDYRSKKRRVEPVLVKRKSRCPAGSAGGEKLEKKVLEAAINVAKSTQNTKLKKKKEKLGTLDCPFTLTDDELDDLSEEEGKKSEEEDLGFGDARAHHEVRDNTENVCKDTEAKNEGKRKIEMPAKKKVCNAPVFINKILVKSIWEKGDVQLETLSPTRENPSDEVELLPRIFNYSSDEDRETPKKSEWDLEAEKLFEEMNYVQGLLNLGTSDVDMVDSEENISSKTNKDSSCFCPDCGDQKLVLDDEIGVRCTVCSFVVQEIGNLMPDFVKHRGGRAGARDYERVDYPKKSAFELDDFTSKNFPDFENNLQVEGTVWELIPGIRNGMYPHQREGFEFIWKNISESIFIDQAKKCIDNGGGSGCIMSHAPGTGKTRLTIMFLQSYMQLNPDCCPLIIAPCSMLLTWEQELRKWNIGLPFHNLNSPEYSGKESKNAVKLQKGDRRHGYNLETTRLVKLLSWRSEKSVLGISYQLFEELAYINALIDKGKEKVKDIEIAGNIRKMLLNLPGILVLDEGHIPRNHESHIWKALLEVRTQRRIILSGTPFQNRFDELFNTFCLARPKFPDEIMPNSQGNTNENRRRITNKVREKWAKMTSNIREDDQKLNELKERIGKFVHVYKGTILKQKLPGLRVSVVVLSPTDLQKDLIEVIKTRKNSLERDHLHSLVSVHSSLFLSVVLSEKEEIIARKNDLKRLKLNPKAGVKAHFLLELIKLSWALKERVLVFGQFIHSLKLIMDILKNQFNWTEGKEILYMSGGHNEKQRQTSINLINDPESEVKVLLASSRACSEGINLVGASRVVLLDVVWNPSVTRQSISRAYRLGQKKVVHVYHLIDGTWEGTKFLKQAEKVGISDLVFGSKDGAIDNPEISGEDKVLQDMVQHPSMKNIFSKILYQPTELDLIDAFDIRPF